MIVICFLNDLDYMRQNEKVGKSAKYVKHAALSPHILLQIPMLLEAVITPVPYDQMV